MYPGASRAGESELMVMNFDEFFILPFPFHADHIPHEE